MRLSQGMGGLTRGLIEASRDGCPGGHWLLWKVPRYAHRLRLGCSAEKPVGWGWRRAHSPAQKDLCHYSSSKVGGRRGCRAPDAACSTCFPCTDASLTLHFCPGFTFPLKSQQDSGGISRCVFPKLCFVENVVGKDVKHIPGDRNDNWARELRDMGFLGTPRCVAERRGWQTEEGSQSLPSLGTQRAGERHRAPGWAKKGQSPGMKGFRPDSGVKMSGKRGRGQLGCTQRKAWRGVG